MEIPESIAKSVEQGDVERVLDLTRGAIDRATAPEEILGRGLIAGMNVVGERFKNQEIFLPDVLLAAKAMEAGMDVLKPLLIRDGVPTFGKVVMGTVKGDLHDIGKNLVGILLRGAGFEVVDLGKDVTPGRFVEAAVQEGARVIGLSAMLTTTMPVMKGVVELVRSRGLADTVKVIVGGAPVTERFALDIGADSYGADGVHAVEQVKRLRDLS